MDEAVAEIKAPWNRGHRPLHLAAAAGKVEICKFLIKDLKVDVDTTGSVGVTPLILAIQHGCSVVIRFLLVHDADPSKAASNGVTPLHTAAAQDACELAELLLSKLKELMLTLCGRKELRCTLLCQRGNARMMELLLQHQADPNAAVLLVHTPLKAAVFARSLKGSELLIKAGADVNAGQPVTPLIVAATAGFTDCVKCLLKAHANANIPDNAVETDPGNSTLYAKRSLCSLHTGEKSTALDDADTYKGMEPDLSKSCYAQGAALILVKEYDRACEVLMSGLHLDFESKLTDTASSGDHQ